MEKKIILFLVAVFFCGCFPSTYTSNFSSIERIGPKHGILLEYQSRRYLESNWKADAEKMLWDDARKAEQFDRIPAGGFCSVKYTTTTLESARASHLEFAWGYHPDSLQHRIRGDNDVPNFVTGSGGTTWYSNSIYTIPTTVDRPFYFFVFNTLYGNVTQFRITP